MVGTCSTNGRGKECIQDICGKARRKQLLGKPRRKWVDNISMDLEDMGWDGTDWIGLA
jgi:hypothetical protein